MMDLISNILTIEFLSTPLKLWTWFTNIPWSLLHISYQIWQAATEFPNIINLITASGWFQATTLCLVFGSPAMENKHQ